jgi:PTS system beta-glucosides-specific IIC component
VQLEGKPFVAHVAVDDRVEVGQLLLEADLAAITAAGYDTTTPVLVVNSSDYAVTIHAAGTVKAGDTLVSIAQKESTTMTKKELA